MMFFKSKPPWKNKDEKKALLAVEKETDQTTLAEIAIHAPHYNVCMEALCKLTDQTEIANIVKNTMRAHVRNEAIKMLTDQAEIIDIINNNENEFLRSQAIQNLTDNNILHNVIKSDTSWRVRIAAADKLKNTVLADNIRNACRAINVNEKYEERIRAVRNITNQDYLADIARTRVRYDWRNMVIDDPSMKDIRQQAIQRITDQTILIEIINGSEEEYVYKHKGTHPNFDDYITYTVDLRRSARKKLSDLQKIQE